MAKMKESGSMFMTTVQLYIKFTKMENLEIKSILVLEKFIQI